MGFNLQNGCHTNVCIYIKLDQVHIIYCNAILNIINHIRVVMTRVFSSDVGRSQVVSYQKNYKICVCCSSALHVAVNRKDKDWLVRFPDNLSKWSDIIVVYILSDLRFTTSYYPLTYPNFFLPSTHEQLFHWASAMKLKLSVLV